MVATIAIVAPATIVLVLPLMLASDLSVSLIVLILQILMEPIMLFRGQTLIVRILVSLVELIVHVSMLLIDLLVLSVVAVGRVSHRRDCKSNHRCSTDSRC